MSTLLDRAATLPLYRAHWHGRTPRALEEAPFVSAWAWRRMVKRHAGALIRPAVLWALHPVPGDDPVWIPFAHDDVAAEARRALDVFRDAGLRPGDVVLSVAPEGPWVGNALPFLMAAADSLVPDRPPLGVQVLPLAVLTVTFRPDLTLFPFRRLPTVLVGSSVDLHAIADFARAAGAPPLRCRLLLLSGPATDPTVVRSFAETCVSLLHLPGALAPFAGRPDGPGVWLPGDKVRAELIPDAEWGRSIQDPAYVPRALPAAAAQGFSGELVVTVDSEALPVIRFRTQERVRVLAADAAGVRISRIAPSPGVVNGLRSAATSMSHG